MADHALSHTEQVRSLFDAKAETWSAKYAPDGRLVGRLTHLAHAIGFKSTGAERVLDLGCGTGELARHLASMGLHVTGCDISPQMLGYAAVADQAGTVNWIQLDPNWQTLPFEAATFDVIVAASVLEYVDSPDHAFREFARLLRTGGIVLCTVPDTSHPIRWLEWFPSKVARLAPLGIAAKGWPRLGRYLTYLRISRQRHSAMWWHATASGAGLSAVPQLTDEARRAPLRTLAFSPKR